MIKWLQHLIRKRGSLREENVDTQISIFDVANYILHSYGDMSTWKLQKLCYYCQAWNVAWTGEVLFPEKFEAWRNGPVCRKLFDYHKGEYWVEESDIPVGDLNRLGEEAKSTIDVVMKYYGKREPWDLREQTHSEPPWINARGGLPDDANCENEITPAAMGEYYGSL